MSLHWLSNNLQAAEVSAKLAKWVDEFKGGNLLDDPDLPPSRNSRVRFITYDSYVKFVMFPEVLFYCTELFYLMFIVAML